MKSIPSNRTLKTWVAALTFILVLPWVMSKFHLYTPKGSYLTVPDTSPTFPYLYQQIFQQSGDIDILFLGSSLLGAAIDTPQVKTKLGTTLGREAHVITLSWNWPGIDLENLVARDLLRRRKVKMAVLTVVDDQTEQQAPHPLLPYTLQFGDLTELFPHVPLLGRIQLFSVAILAAPRQLWMTLRGSDWKPSPEIVDNDGALLKQMGFHSAPFEPNDWHAPRSSPRDLIYSTKTQEHWQFSHKALGVYEHDLWSRLVEKFKSSGTQVVILHIPQYDRYDSKKIPERLDWSKEFGTSVSLVGVPESELFAKLKGEDIQKLYFNNHLNRNGSRYFTESITPALIELYVNPRNTGPNDENSIGISASDALGNHS
jgi:hypothetical protein